MKRLFFFVLFMISARELCGGLSPVPDALAIRAIIGEASGEGYRGMLAVAEGIRNRGHLNGVYGLKARHIRKEAPKVWRAAEKAWKASSRSNLTGGATVWGNKKDVSKFKKTTWFRRYRQTAKIGNHYFFAEK